MLNLCIFDVIHQRKVKSCIMFYLLLVVSCATEKDLRKVCLCRKNASLSSGSFSDHHHTDECDDGADLRPLGEEAVVVLAVDPVVAEKVQGLNQALDQVLKQKWANTIPLNQLQFALLLL